MGAATLLLLGLITLPLFLIGLCVIGVLPNPFLSWFATTLHRINRKGSFAPRKKRKFDYNEIVKHLYVGRQPRDINDLKRLYEEEGIRVILCLNEETELYVKEKDIKRSGMKIKRMHLPVPDYQGATQEQLQTAVSFIDRHIDDGQSVFIHCNGGKGRSAGVAAAYLMYKWRDIDDYHDAVKFVRNQRPVTSNGLDRFPISSSSRSLFVYHATLKNKGEKNLLKHLQEYGLKSIRSFSSQDFPLVN